MLPIPRGDGLRCGRRSARRRQGRVPRKPAMRLLRSCCRSTLWSRSVGMSLMLLRGASAPGISGRAGSRRSPRHVRKRAVHRHRRHSQASGPTLSLPCRLSARYARVSGGNDVVRESSECAAPLDRLKASGSGPEIAICNFKFRAMSGWPLAASSNSGPEPDRFLRGAQ